MNHIGNNHLSCPVSRKQGFTLIEAVVALGVFAFAIAIIMGLFLRASSRLQDAEERAQVSNLMPVVNAKLQEIGWGFETNQSGAGIIDATESGELTLVATPDGNWVSEQGETDGIGDDQQFYLISVTRYVEDEHRYGSDLQGVVLLKVNISWPYRLPAGANGFVETESETRKVFEFLSSVRP